MKIRLRKKLDHTIYIEPGDMLSLQENGKTVMREQIERSLVVTEAITFDLDSSDIEGISDGIGGAFLDIGKKKEEG